MESLKSELQSEKQLSISARNAAKSASKECEAIKRAIQSLGCKVQVSSNGYCTVDIEGDLMKKSNQKSHPASRRTSHRSLPRPSEENDLSLSITVTADDVPSNPLSHICEALCPLRTRDGGCRWPDAGCAHLGSQFIGLKANFDAFDQLSIYDGYFKPE